MSVQQALFRGLAPPPAALSVVGVTSNSQSTTTTFVLGEPAGTAAGDLLVAFIAYRAASTTPLTPPAGWTLHAGMFNNNVDVNTTSGVGSGAICSIRRGASAPNFTFTFPVAPVPAIGRVIAYRGIAADAGLCVYAGFAPTPVNQTFAAWSVDLFAPNNDTLITALAVGGRTGSWSGFQADNTITGASGATDTTIAPQSGTWTERADNFSSSNSSVSMGFFDAKHPSTTQLTGMFATHSSAASHVLCIVGFNTVAPKQISVITMAGSDSVTVPAGATKYIGEAIGGGGHGNNAGIMALRAGGGGGQYARTNPIAVTPGSTIFYSVGFAGDSWVNTFNVAPSAATTGCRAKGGTTSVSGTAGVGNAAGSIGALIYFGGDSYLAAGADGGGAAGASGAGATLVAGTDKTGLSPATPMGSGNGGLGGMAGTAPGGGAGAQMTAGGTIGRVRIQFW